MVRTAGHVLGSEVLGSIEYATSVLGARLVVVLGHDSCGAVAAARAAVEDGFAAGGFVRDVVERVTPSILAARTAGLTSDSDVIDEHIRHTVDLLLDRSRLLSEQVAAGEIAVVGLGYALAEGNARVVTTRGVEAPADLAAPTAEKAPPPDPPARLIRTGTDRRAALLPEVFPAPPGGAFVLPDRAAGPGSGRPRRWRAGDSGTPTGTL